MATFYLVNKVKVGVQTYYPGDLIDDAQDDSAGIAAAGGRLYPSANATVASAAALAQGLTLRGQHEQAAGIMLAAASKADALGADTVTVASTTATNQTTTATNQAATATNQAAGVEHVVSFAPTLLPAAGVTIHAQDPGGGALNLVAGFTIPLPGRNIAITRSAAGPANVTYAVTWNSVGGGTFVENIVVPSGGTTAGTLSGLGIVSITTSVDPVSTTDFVTGVGVNLGIVFSGTPVVSMNSVREAAASFDGASGTVFPTTAPDGAKAFAFLVTGHLHNHTQDSHNHVQDAHGHTQNAHAHSATIS